MTFSARPAPRIEQPPPHSVVRPDGHSNCKITATGKRSDCHRFRSPSFVLPDVCNTLTRLTERLSIRRLKPNPWALPRSADAAGLERALDERRRRYVRAIAARRFGRPGRGASDGGGETIARPLGPPPLLDRAATLTRRKPRSCRRDRRSPLHLEAPAAAVAASARRRQAALRAAPPLRFDRFAMTPPFRRGFWRP